MAEPKYKPHPIIKKLEQTGAVKLLGYFGGTTDGVVKIYPSLDDLSVCLSVREADILHVEEATAEECPHGGSAIWVKADALVERTVTSGSSVQARFLAGGIAARMAGGPAVAYARAAGSGQDQPATWGPEGCTYSGTGCNFSVWPCSVVWGACLKSADMPCEHTKQWWCPGDIYTAKSCFTCAGYTCVAECYSAGCPFTVRCPPSVPYTRCGCEVFSAFCQIR